MKKIFSISLLSTLLVSCGTLTVSPTAVSASQTLENPIALPDYKNATYLIEGQFVTLTDGFFETEITPGSASKITTRFFGNEAFADLNGDGKEDVAFLVTQNSGGSGTFFYVVAALQNDTGYQGTNAILLGDRISPQTTNIQNGTIIVNYADRNPGESFDTLPSLGISKFLQVTKNILVEIQNP